MMDVDSIVQMPAFVNFLSQMSAFVTVEDPALFFSDSFLRHGELGVSSNGAFPSNKQILDLLDLNSIEREAFFVGFLHNEGVNQYDLNLVLLKNRGDGLKYIIDKCHQDLNKKRRTHSESFWNSNFDINLHILHAGIQKEVGDDPLVSISVPEPSTTVTGPATPASLSVPLPGTPNIVAHKHKHDHKASVGISLRGKRLVYRSTYQRLRNSSSNAYKKAEKRVTEMKIYYQDELERLNRELTKVKEDHEEQITQLTERHLKDRDQLKKENVSLTKRYNELREDYDYLVFQQDDKDEGPISDNDEDVAEVYEELKVSTNNFSEESIFPQLNTRDSARKINPAVVKALAVLRFTVGLSLRNSLLALLSVANVVFNQKWRLPKGNLFVKSMRMKRVIGNEELPDGDDASNTLPSMSYIADTVQHLVEKNSKKRVFDEIRSDETKKVTLSTDGFTEERQK
eukprot:sb/3464553/